jgi:hypothetical protein
MDIINLIANLKALKGMLEPVAGLIGFFILSKALHRLRYMSSQHMMGMMRENLTMSGIVTHFVVGSCLISISGFIEMATSTFFGGSSDPFKSLNNPLQYSTGGLEGGVSQLPTDIFYLCLTIIGVISIIRGLMMLTDGKSEGGISQSFVHIIAGVIAINMLQIINLINK